jgi:hypothetical protein
MWQPATTISGFSLLTFPSNCLCSASTTNRFGSYASVPTLASKGNPLSCKIAHEFKDDLNDDSIRKGCQSIERSTISARQTAMT